MRTNKQDGTLSSFIEKEGKWYNFIKGVPRPLADSATGIVGQDFMGNELKTEEFSFQGLGYAQSVINTSSFIPGCTDPAATNYNPSANVDNGTCLYPPPPSGGAGA